MRFTPSYLWFNFVHQHYLIYNMCWEDAAIDRHLLKLDHQSNVLMISSAGCNALSYLLDNPKSIHSVDINPRQTALLELKLKILIEYDYQIFVSFFWDGSCANYRSVYNAIRGSLSQPSQEFWDSNIDYFSPTQRGLHFEGGSGIFARFLNKIIDRKSLREDIIQLSVAKNYTEREQLFSTIEKELWHGVESNIWQTNGMLSLAGIPAVQRNAIGDINQFMRKVLHQIFVDQQAVDNPYWGRYLKLPNLQHPTLEYLKAEHFELLRNRASNLNYATKSFIQQLTQSKEPYSHFVLLDHMDWMVGHDKKALEEEWKLILERALPNAKVLFRTAFQNIDFIPDFARERCKINQIDPEWLRINDRVGTYTGTYLGVIE